MLFLLLWYIFFKLNCSVNQASLSKRLLLTLRPVEGSSPPTPKGKQSYCTVLLVFQIARPEETQPEFLVPIQDLTIREGETARFNCQVKSLPEATLVWYHQNKPIKSDDIFQIVPGEDGQSSLIIAEAFPEDSGEYTVRAINSAGETECSAVLTVEGMWKLCPFRANEMTLLAQEHTAGLTA